jgi:hypothetical protein
VISFFCKVLVVAAKVVNLSQRPPTADHRLPTADFFQPSLGNKQKTPIFAILLVGTIAQLVEQRTENPCVAGSNPAGTTGNPAYGGFFIITASC